MKARKRRSCNITLAGLLAVVELISACSSQNLSYERARADADVVVSVEYGSVAAIGGTLFWSREGKCLTMKNTRGRLARRCNLPELAPVVAALQEQIQGAHAATHESDESLGWVTITMGDFRVSLPAEKNASIESPPALANFLAQLERAANRAFGRSFDFSVIESDSRLRRDG